MKDERTIHRLPQYHLPELQGGRLRRKNEKVRYPFLLKALLGKKSNDKINLNIIGDGSNLEALKNIVKEEKIANVYFWGRRPLKEMPRWFEGSDVLIISLIDEPIFSLTIPAKFQAYLASGKPIYCVMNGEVADLIINNKIGFVAQPDDINNIRSRFEKFLDTPKQELQAFGSNMKTLLSNEFDRNKIIQQMTEEIFV